MRFEKSFSLFMLVGVLSLLFFLTGVSAAPNGATVTPGSSGTAPDDVAGNNSAYAGNVTELTITAYSTTPSWQGYFGNVSGAIQLADGSDNVLYNWSLVSPSGEVYASTNSSITWANIQCLNFTATGAGTDESGNGGTTNLYGINLSALESRFNIVTDDVDGVNETFTLSGAGTHDLFYTSNQQFSEGECVNTRAFDSTGQGVNNNFEEVLLYEPASASVVFASILDSDVSGFDSASHDFEMLVLEDGHGVDVSTTTYFFFTELE